MKISSATGLYAVIGYPIEHSFSPVMHNIAFQRLGLNNVYLAFRVMPKNLESAIIGMKSLGILGFNVTVPHKVAVMQYLDKVDGHAVEVGAVNTVVNKEGVLTGYNTDGAGALAVFREEHVKLKGHKVVLLGAGGAAQALASSIAPLAESLVILNRSESKAQHLASSLKARLNSNIVGKKLTEITLHRTLADADVLINATSVGMYPKTNATLVTREMIHPETTVFDIVYNPLTTRLLREAEAAGAHVIRGLKMLVYQGALAFELWTGRNPPVDAMYEAVEQALTREGNE